MATPFNKPERAPTPVSRGSAGMSLSSLSMSAAAKPLVSQTRSPSAAAMTASRNTIAAIAASKGMSTAQKVYVPPPTKGAKGMGGGGSVAPPPPTSVPTDIQPAYQESAPQESFQTPEYYQEAQWIQDSPSSNGAASWPPDASATPSSLASTSLARRDSGITAMAVATPSGASAPVQTVAPTLWQRILAFFGFGPKNPAAPSKISGDPTNRQDAIASLVRRARNGDQNAMATIAEVAKQAKAGNQLAAASERLFHEYIKTNPPGGVVVFGGDIDPNPIYTEAVRLSHGPLLSNLRIETLLSTLEPHEHDTFMRGLKGIADARGGKVNRAGLVIGQARKLQAVRMNISPIAKYDQGVAWELGE